jgi:hypothetical protein
VQDEDLSFRQNLEMLGCSVLNRTYKKSAAASGVIGLHPAFFCYHWRSDFTSVEGYRSDYEPPMQQRVWRSL